MDVGWILMHFGWLLLVFGTIVMNFLECDWIVGPRRFSPAICIYIYIYRHICIHIYIYIYISRMYTRLICLSFPTVSRMQVCIRFFRVYIYIYLYVSYFSGSSACYPFWIDFGSFRMDSVVCWGEEAIF